MMSTSHRPHARALAALTALLLLLAGCGASGGSQATELEPDAAAQSILENVTFRDTLVKAEGGAAENYYRLSGDVAAYAIYVSGSGATAEEIAVLKAADPAQLDAVKAIAEKRVENLKFQFENYVPQEMVKLGDPVLISRGDVVILVIADDSSQAQKAVDALFS